MAISQAVLQLILQLKDEASAGLSKAQGMLGSLGGIAGGVAVAGLGAAAAAAGAVGAAALDMAGQVDAATRTFQAQLGASAEEAERLADISLQVFGNNFGATVDEAAQAVATVRQQVRGLADEDLQATTEGVYAIADAFGEDFSKVANSVNTLMEQFGLSSEQALDFVARGFQQGLNTSEDFADSIGEYSNQFAEAGFSAEQMFSAMQTGIQGGVLGTDKILDAWKEARIRLLEMSEDVWGPDGVLRNGLQLADEDVSRLFEGLQDGSVTVEDAFSEILPALQAMDNQVWQNSAGVALFGTQWEDLGAQAILGLDLAATAMEDMAGATDSLNVQYESLGAVLSGAWRQLLIALQPAADALLNLANQHMPTLITAMQGGIALIGNTWNALAPILLTVLGVIQNVIVQAQTGMSSLDTGPFQQAFAAAQAVVAAVMPAIQTIVGTVLAAVTTFWQQNGAQILAFVQTTFTAIGTIINLVMQLIRAIIVPTLTAIAGFIASNQDAILAIIEHVWTNISTVIDTAITLITGMLETALALLEGDWETAWTTIQRTGERIWQNIQTLVTTTWDTIKRVVTSVLGDVVREMATQTGAMVRDFATKVAELPRDMGGAIGNVLSAIAGKAGELIASGTAAAGNIVSGFGDRITELAGKATSAAREGIRQLGNLAGEWLRKGTSLATSFVDGLVAGIRNGASRIWEAARQVAQDAWEGAMDIFRPGSPSRLMIEAGRDVYAAGLAEGILKGRTMVRHAAEDLARDAVQAGTPMPPDGTMMGASGADASGDITLNLTITINGSADRQAITDIRTIVERAVRDALQQTGRRIDMRRRMPAG